MRCSGIEIDTVTKDSPAWNAGLRPGDILRSMNSHPLADVIDFMFHRCAGMLDIEFVRGSEKNRVTLDAGEESDLGITLKPFKVRTCKNNCVFCFVKQLPRGLRKSLYVKDEDYRLSFLYGNYVTLSNLDANDKKRIIEQRLSPLYVSVHTTNRTLRNKMLGNPRGADIMKELKYLTDRKIRIHTQIVLCPGHNDGKELQKTIKDLYKFYPYVSSIAVVPVGLTMHRKHQVSPLTKEDALKAVAIVDSFQRRFKKTHGDPVVFCSDEMLIKAGVPFPPLKEYGSLPQLENGVGMVPHFIARSRRVRVPKSLSLKKKVLTLTGTSFYPYLRKYIERISEKVEVEIDVIPVENHFFGTSVTVTGLLTGRDIMKALHDIAGSNQILVVPETCLKDDTDLLLDDVSLKDIEEATGFEVYRTEASPQGFIDALASIPEK